MRFILAAILLSCGLNSYSQDSTNQKASKLFFDDKSSLKFEGSIYFSENLSSNYSFDKESGLIYNLSLKITADSKKLKFKNLKISFVASL